MTRQKCRVGCLIFVCSFAVRKTKPFHGKATQYEDRGEETVCHLLSPEFTLSVFPSALLSPKHLDRYCGKQIPIENNVNGEKVSVHIVSKYSFNLIHENFEYFDNLLLVVDVVWKIAFENEKHHLFSKS